MRKLIKILSALAVLTGSLGALAAPIQVDPVKRYHGGHHQTHIDFEDGVVEALNKRPLDSFSQLSEADRKSQTPHLYKKRVNFSDQVGETLEQLRYNP